MTRQQRLDRAEAARKQALAAKERARHGYITVARVRLQDATTAALAAENAVARRGS